MCLQMDRALQVRRILATRGLTLYSLSRKSAEIFGHSSHFHVPHNLYYDLARPTSKPTIYQILALSHITDYRLSDWLAVFGFDLNAISRLQLLIPRQQTTILDSTVYDTYAWIPWFAERPEADPAPSIAPLGHFLTSAPPKRARDLFGLNSGKFLYAKVGEQDLYALPYFAPGSIVRVDTRAWQSCRSVSNANGRRPFLPCGARLRMDMFAAHSARKGPGPAALPATALCRARVTDRKEMPESSAMIDAEIRPVSSHRPRQVIVEICGSAEAATRTPGRMHKPQGSSPAFPHERGTILS